jgi:hypothetical protein
MVNVARWMSWQDGIDLVGVTRPDLQMPNVIVHLGRIINTPVGNAPAGMILWQPDPNAMPAVMGFICSDKDVGKYFGPNIFNGTPFEHVPVLNGTISIQIEARKAISKCTVGGYTFEVEMSDFSGPYLINREPGEMSPFWQQGVEMSCGKTIFKVNGNITNLIIPPVGITGGPASVVAPNGIYAR